MRALVVVVLLEFVSTFHIEVNNVKYIFRLKDIITYCYSRFCMCAFRYFVGVYAFWAVLARRGGHPA